MAIPVTAPAVLRSEFDPATATISLEFDPGGHAIEPGTRLALTSIVQLTPTEPALLVAQLASYHELALPAPAPETGSFRISAMTLSHLPNHANDGPVSAFLIGPDGNTTTLRVEPMRRRRDADSVALRPEQREQPPSGIDLLPLVPHPVSLLTSRTEPRHRRLRFGSGPGTARRAFTAIADLERRIRAEPAVAHEDGAPVDCIVDPSFVDEQYRIVTDTDRVDVVAAGEAGFRHAFVTLAQCLIAGVPIDVVVDDRPALAFRGLHVDLARQWFEPEVVLRLIDLCAWRKLTHLHLHLTDDEAWRFEVGGFPELMQVGRRGHGLPLPPMLGGGPEPVGRVYSATEIARWNDRASTLGVTLVPEVDFPAHVHAVLTAIPSLRDPDDQSQATSVQYFVDNVLVPGHPATTPFVEQVIDAVATSFPGSPYVHIGGDEVPDGAWSRSPIVESLRRRSGASSTRDVEALFHRQLVESLARHGRRIGAWQEAAESGGVSPGDGYVIGWRTAEASRQLAAQGYDVVVSPGEAYYLDMACDDEWSTPGASWAGSTSLADVCAFEPGAGWTDAELEHLLGVQACLWTEHVRDEATLRDRLLPRLDAIAERAWTGSIVGGVASIEARSRQVRESRR